MSIAANPHQAIQSDEWNRLQSHCRGVTPLNARWADWMVDALTLHSASLHRLIEEHGSPINVVTPVPLQRNLKQLCDVACEREVDFRPFFARKANKCLTFVDAAKQIDAGVDVASEPECQQTLDRGIPGPNIICTAAIKTWSLIELCVRNQVTIAVDNDDELDVVDAVTSDLSLPANIAIRLSGFSHNETKLHSRFGFDIDSVHEVEDKISLLAADEKVKLHGLHFHLDGYCADQRKSAIKQCLPWIDRLRSQGHDIRFLDIGGGLPMSYLNDNEQWDRFWKSLRESLRGHQPPITYRNHGLGLRHDHNGITDTANTYPYFQQPVRAEWFAEVLDADSGENCSIASAIKKSSLQLRCEPGRSSLDACGMTVARVEFTKHHPNGDWFIGLGMNRTQCRTGSDDFLVDPVVLTSPKDFDNATETTATRSPRSGYLVGAYCTESELIQLRKLQFPQGIQRGDLVVFPNTAGYFMHFLESRSHQFPLAKNVVFDEDSAEVFRLDAIDAKSL
ncbi:Y4yA family PLP-dependent enzyme [Rhodopirellula sallentina]|uniref:Diaminopimelate decarboxylase n=1 Tax=Rhodopirellula sallentina SM41 TaxID=1263870 RepID=M5TW76_9BACT|nr:Y4yA family PLP-dependent enzyme [Rhodopirellula sallentina]EMI53284.1 diaminopimelate decarboxylase [Rhodopirellula sallentina SM41]